MKAPLIANKDIFQTTDEQGNVATGNGEWKWRIIENNFQKRCKKERIITNHETKYYVKIGMYILRNTLALPTIQYSHRI
jgi:hypothetical protein